MTSDRLLAAAGRRIRDNRLARGWTLRELAERSGISSRFLVQIESGRANLSVRRLADLAAALELPPAVFLAEAPSRAVAPVVALLGLRGAGKSTIGRRLARRLRGPFVELDRRIEEAADLSLGEIFTLHGEEYYRRLERETLEQVLREQTAMVLATGGGIVTSRETYTLLRRSALTVWLRARPEDHWNRVVRQGDRRPMADHPQAMADLRSLLATREPLYAAASHTIDTSALGPREAAEAIARCVMIDQ